MNLRSFPTKIHWLFKFLGWRRALAVCFAKPIAAIAKGSWGSEWFWRFTESQFDVVYGVDTVEIVPVESLGIAKRLQSEVVFYEPTPIMEFGYIISRLRSITSDHVFVDVGSGKGRNLLLANWFNFKRIVGVEISEKLHQKATANIDVFRKVARCKNTFSVCDDAAKFEFPQEPLVVFLFNPFGADLMRRFLDNLRRSLEKNYRSVTLIYANPRHHHVIESEDWLHHVDSELGGWYRIYSNEEPTSKTSDRAVQKVKVGQAPV